MIWSESWCPRSDKKCGGSMSETASELVLHSKPDRGPMSETNQVKKRAPTLYVIIAIKLLKGLLFVGLAVTMYTLSDNNLPAELRNVLHHLRLNPERKFWSDLARMIGQWTEVNILWAAAG